MSTQVATKGAQNLTIWESFEEELKSRELAICSMLPSHVNKERFKNSVIAAVKQTPGLLKATPRSLFASVSKSAQDGLLPDGREGVITVYKDEAQWNPMAFGLRKRAREIDEIMVDAQVVYKKDEFIWRQGDNPRIEHNPAPLGVSRGEMIGAYAVFRNQDGILHREVMDAGQIEKVRSQSKQPNGLLWGKFAEEAWRKTVVRRGFKSVPCSEKLGSIVRRDDDNYEFDQPQIDAPLRPQRVEYQPEPPAQGEAFDARYSQTMAEDETESETPSEAEATGDMGPGGGEEVAAAPSADPSAGSPSGGLPFLADDGRAILYDGKGKEIGRYGRAGNFFKAVMVQIPNEDDPLGFVESAEAAANHFVNKDKSLMAFWDECNKAANDAAAMAEATG